MIPEESIENMICDYLEGDRLSAEQQAEFESALYGDPEALDLLCLHALMDASLRQGVMTIHSDTTEQFLARQKRRALRISFAAAAAMILALGLVLYMVATPKRMVAASIEAAAHTHFNISSGSSSGDPMESGILNPGESISIAQGTVRLTLPDGSRCLAEAPAILTFHEPGKMHLSGGMARFDIAKGSEGFTVTTQDLEVVDLGTAFGIDDRRDGQPQLHVISGKVRAETRSGRHEFATLTGGQAVTVGGAGTLRPIPTDLIRFPSDLPSGLPAFQVSFDPDQDGQLAAEGSLAIQAGVKLSQLNKSENSPSLTGGHRGSALHFVSGNERLESTWPGIDGTLPRTISFWMKLGPEEYEGGHILGWGLYGGSEKMSHFSLRYTNSKSNLRISWGHRWLQSSSRLDDGKWHHLAIVLDSYDPGELPHVKFYLDGKPEALAERRHLSDDLPPLDSFSTVTDHPRSRSLTFGMLNPDSKSGAVIGSIDEVIIAAGIVGEAEIQALADDRPEDAGLDLSTHNP